MAVFTRPDSPFYWLWLEGAARPKVNTKIPIGATADAQKENRKLAEQAYHALMGDRARARYQLPTDRPPRAFAAHREWYAAHVSAQKRGTRREISMLKQLGAFFDARDLAAIDTTLAIEWRTVRLKEVSASTVRREEALLKHLLTTAVPKYLARNPLAGLARLRVATCDTRILSPAEEDRLIEVLETDEDRALVLGGLDTLLRLSNIAGLRRSQDHGTYLFSDTKVDAVKIPISTRFRQALDKLPTTTALYFPTYAGQNNPAQRMFLAACRRAEIPTSRKHGGVSFHCLRHTGASRMLANGTDVKTVMLIGGWKNLKVMERYLHPDTSAARRAVESIAHRAKLTLVAGAKGTDGAS
jgi:integrase